MDDVDLEELRMLRARAYGPSADIRTDPAAQRRLNQLEAAARSAPPAVVSATPLGGAASGRPGPPPPLPPGLSTPTPARGTTTPARLAEPTVTVAGGAAAASSGPSARQRRTAPAAGPAPRRWFLSRGFAWLWLASLVAVGAVAAGVAFAAFWVAPVMRHVDAQQIATLSPDPDFPWIDALQSAAGDDSVGFTFHGLSLVQADTNLFGLGSAGSPCLVAYPTASATDDSISGPFFSGCAAGAFPATVQLTADTTMPAELLDAVGEGTALQFVLDGDRVGVFSDAK
ncbi:hypothetical protein ET475_02525 [Microbacterium protaetiae]|uniref:Uncharacterized protein n=1 Tax=Microbacterium protaetiae TaxID=2509458 RepID=A0A4P6ED58_9MICO|nr:hypothetical protein [Microbacterium protaetiae]QAY58979.1 hypothetical protein ET475_02525 [Microbacterium protaetiae]